MNSPASAKESVPAESQMEQSSQPTTPAGRLEQNQDEPKIPEVLPILPVRSLVVFPGTVVPLTIGRPKSLKLLDESLPRSKIIGVMDSTSRGEGRP